MAKSPPKKAPAPAPQTTPETDGALEAEQLERVGEPLPDTPDFSADEAELGGESTSYRWHLSRAVIVGGRRTWETCTSYPAGIGALTADVVREDWGPGQYYAQLRPAPGSGVGHGGVKKTRTFQLAAPRAATVSPVPATSTTETLLQRMIETQQAGFIKLGEMLAARPGAAATDPNQLMDLALRMAERMTPKGRDVDPLEQIDRWGSVFEKFRTGKDWTDLISEGISTVRPLVDVAVQKLGGGAPTEPTPNTPAAAPAPVNGSQPKIEGPMWQLQLAQFLKRQSRYLIGKAKAKASASLYAEMLLDNLPEAVTFPALLELLKRPNALQAVFDQMPPDERAAAETERAWFEELLREMVTFLEPIVHGGPAPGDKGEAESDTPEV